MKIFKNETKMLLKQISKFTSNIEKKEDKTLLSGTELEVIANNTLNISKNGLTISYFNHEVKIYKSFKNNHYSSLGDATITIKLTFKELKEILSDNFEVILNKDRDSMIIDTPRKSWQIERVHLSLSVNSLVDASKKKYDIGNFDINKLTISAIATNHPKHELNGLLFDLENNCLVSTNTKQLVKQKIKSDSNQKFIIPKKMVFETMRNIALYDDDIISFDNEDVHYQSRLIRGSFPNYQRIVPNYNSDRGISFNHEDINKLKLKNESYAIKINDRKISFIEDIEKITYPNEINSMESKLNIECNYTGNDSIILGLDATFLKYGIKDAKIWINGNNTPLIIFNDNIEHIIMPLILKHSESLNYEKNMTQISHDWTWNKEVIKKTLKRVNYKKLYENSIQEIELLKNEIDALKKEVESWEDKFKECNKNKSNNFFELLDETLNKEVDQEVDHDLKEDQEEDHDIKVDHDLKEDHDLKVDHDLKEDQEEDHDIKVDHDLKEDQEEDHDLKVDHDPP